MLSQCAPPCVCVSADTLAYLDAQARQLQEPTADTILAESVSPEEIERQWQLVQDYCRRLRPQDAHHYVPFLIRA